jgi:hypothetical protein
MRNDIVHYHGFRGAMLARLKPEASGTNILAGC